MTCTLALTSITGGAVLGAALAWVVVEVKHR